MADLKTVLCVLGALGGLFVVTCNGSVDVPCDSLLSGGVPVEQCLGEYVCHNGTCAERWEKMIACIIQVLKDLLMRCFPGMQLPESTFTDLVQSVSFLNATFCSGQYWNISSYAASQLDTRGKCTERFNEEYAECSESFLHKFLTGRASADLLCREYQTSLQCITQLAQSECSFNQSEQAILFAGTQSNPFCQCNAMTTEGQTTKPISPSTRAVPFTPLMILSLIVCLFCIAGKPPYGVTHQVCTEQYKLHIRTDLFDPLTPGRAPTLFDKCSAYSKRRDLH